jgi:hypothetical protein
MYDALGKQLGTAVFYFVGPVGWEVSFAGKETGTLTWRRDEPLPTVEELQEALWRGSWEEVRTRRNELLAETDFYALSDVTMSADMATYRESLRDLPASVENSEDVVWPEKPS